MWVDVLTPIFPALRDSAFIEDLAVLGRSIADGATVANSFDGTTYARHADTFATLVKTLAAHQRSIR
jgi:hypothetical protein